MGHREALLIGAKRCLAEKGYTRTTTRDIVAASGANLASIGYHFGSKEALLNQALVESLGEWGSELGRIFVETAAADRDSAYLEVLWSKVVALFEQHRQVLLASIEAISQVDHVPAVREILSSGLEQGRLALAQMFGTVVDPEDPYAHAVGSVYQAMLTGLIAQWLVDPEKSPSGPAVAEALAVIAVRHPAQRDRAAGGTSKPRRQPRIPRPE